MIRPFVILALLAASLAHAETYYLAPDGKDSAKGTGEDKPWRTLYKISDAAKPGDTFILASGIYELGKSFPTLTCAGTAEAPIRIRAAEGARPRLRFEGWSGIKIGPGAAHLEISGVDIEGAAASITLDEAKTAPEPKKSGRFNGNGISIDGRKPAGDTKTPPHHITLRDLRVWACPGGGIAAMHSDYVTIEDCTVSGCAWYSTFACSGISVWQAWNFDREPGYHIRIRRNRCFDNRQYLPARAGGAITDGNGIIIDDSRNTQQGSKLGIYEGRVLIEGNASFNNGGSGIHAYESDHVDILGNVVWMNNQTPEYTGGQLFVNDASDIRIEGNTIGALGGKEATNNFRRDERPENAGIVWKNNLIFHGQPGKGTADGNLVVDLPPPMQKPAAAAPGAR
jgi:hypothetical protein